jgi:hypothetical protein
MPLSQNLQLSIFGKEKEKKKKILAKNTRLSPFFNSATNKLAEKTRTKNTSFSRRDIILLA